MAPMNGYITNPHHRQNRRRERPGSRTRRTLTRKANIQLDYHEGLLDARDMDVSLPSDKSRPSPLLRQNFDQSWQRWKARAAEEKALAEMDTMQLLMEEQRRLFGDLGDAGDDDDELHRMGILYNEDDTDTARDEDLNIISCDLPVEQSQYFPMFVIRHAKAKRSRRRVPSRHSLSPLYLSFSALSDDSDIARLLSHSIHCTPTPNVQYREPRLVSISPEDIDIPQSLPPPSAFESILFGSGSGSVSISHNTPAPAPISLPAPGTSLLPHQGAAVGDWTFITHPQATDTNSHTELSTPSSEPETWILIDDS